jgi:hypothetical protein
MEVLMTLSDLFADLQTADPEADLVFTADGTPIRGGYHVTEFQVAQIRSMTCGGDTDAWDEARIQLMDGHDMAGPMKVGRFLRISTRVQERFPEIVDLPLRLEFAPDNAALGIYHAEAPVASQGQVTVPLTSGRAICKAMPAPATTSCCGTGAVACCL